MRALVLSFVLLAGCPSWFGLTELSELPADFPVTPLGERGNITVSEVAPDGRVATAVDFAFWEEAEAEEAYAAVRAELAAAGWTETGTLEEDEGVVFSRGADSVDVSCCRQRADTMKLVLVAWHHAP